MPKPFNPFEDDPEVAAEAFAAGLVKRLTVSPEVEDEPEPEPDDMPLDHYDPATDDADFDAELAEPSPPGPPAPPTELLAALSSLHPHRRGDDDELEAEVHLDVEASDEDAAALPLTYEQHREPTPDWIPGIMPADEVHLLSGSSGVGKTALIAQFIRALYAGEPVFGLTPQRAAPFVGVITSDRPWKDHQKWFATVGLPFIPHYSLIDDPQIAGKLFREGRVDRSALLEQSLGKLAASLGLPRLPEQSLIIVDPISLFLGGDLLNYDKVFSHMFDANQLCLKHRITLLALAHTAKQVGDPKRRYARPQDRIMGSTAQTGCAGTTFHLAPPSETEQDWYEFTWVPHHAAADTVAMERGKDGLFYQLSVSAEERGKKGASGLQKRAGANRVRSTAPEAAARRSTILALFPAPTETITTAELVAQGILALQLTRRMVTQCIEELAAVGEIERVGRGVWKKATLTPN